MRASASVLRVPWPTWRDLIGPPKHAMRDFSIAALLAAWVALIGPFGNDEAGPLETRLLYHLTLSAAVVAVYRPGVRLGVALGVRLGAGKVVSAILAILIVSGPMSVFVSFVAVQFFPQLRDILTPLDWYLQLVVLILPIALGYQIFSGFLSRAPTPVVASAAAVETLAPPQSTRLPVAVETILALHVEDHYLRVHTPSGSRLVYLTMSEAPVELGAVEGLQVHRSWWVARGAVERVVRRGRGADLHLSGGLLAPVARARLPALKAAGWLAPPL